MVRKSFLNPAESGEFIAKNAQYVKIRQEGIEKLSDEMLPHITAEGIKLPKLEANSIQDYQHPRAVDAVFLTDALNFCFWSKTEAEQWIVDGHTGYYALEAALYRAHKAGFDITNPEYYSTITEEDLKIIMKGDTLGEVPLFNQRLTVMHEIGSILINKYSGTFENCVKDANKSAVRLLEIVVEGFPCFQDEALYKGQKVSFYKRAQILIADLWNFFGGTSWGEFDDIDKLTMFADYRVPQVLLYFDVLGYSDDLKQKLKNDIVLGSGSDEEVEIRGCSIHSVELLKTHIEHKIISQQLNVKVPNSILIDFFLWFYRRKHAKDIEKVPYHKTLSIFY